MVNDSFHAKNDFLLLKYLFFDEIVWFLFLQSDFESYLTDTTNATYYWYIIKERVWIYKCFIGG